MKSIGMELNSLNNIIKRTINKDASKQMVDKLTGTNGWILAYIAKQGDNPVYQKTLEKEFTITRSTASKVVDLMVQKGFIIKKSVEGDARLKRLCLTEKAFEVIYIMNNGCEKFEKKLTNGFSDEEQEQMLSYIHRLKNNLV